MKDIFWGNMEDERHWVHLCYLSSIYVKCLEPSLTKFYVCQTTSGHAINKCILKKRALLYAIIMLSFNDDGDWRWKDYPSIYLPHSTRKHDREPRYVISSLVTALYKQLVSHHMRRRWMKPIIKWKIFESSNNYAHQHHISLVPKILHCPQCNNNIQVKN